MMTLKPPASRVGTLTSFSFWTNKEVYIYRAPFLRLAINTLGTATLSARSYSTKHPPKRLRCRRQLSYATHLRAKSAAQAVADPAEVLDNTLVPPQTSEFLHPPSVEQQVAIDILLHSNDNLVVDACAGSGKTTTILHFAKAAPGVNFLVLVYNQRLMNETAEKVNSLGLENMTVSNYHTLGVRYYTPECATDQGLKRVVEDDMSVLDGMKLPDFSVLIMDEQQDMTPIMKRFVDKVIRDKGFATRKQQTSGTDRSKKRPKKTVGQLRVFVLGDRRQEVYGFNNADSRFLTMAGRSEVFGYINEHSWTNTPQTTSNRVTQQNMVFINNQMVKLPLGEALRAVRSHDKQGRPFPKPRYVVCDTKGEDLLEEVERLLQMPDMSPSDIIVVAPSVRKPSPALNLANALAFKGIPVFRSDSDLSDIPPEVAYGKVLICTYHQAKGIERKSAIVMGFDESYHSLYAKVASPPAATSNPQYVAATRALEHLVLVHDYKNAPLPFVNMDTLKDSGDLVLVRDIEVKRPRATPSHPILSVTSLCRNLSETLITECLQRLNIDLLSPSAHGVPPPPTLVADKFGLWEGVSDITGIAVPAIFEWRSRKSLSLLSDLSQALEPPKRKTSAIRPIRRLPPEYLEKARNIRDSYENGNDVSTEDILFVANMYAADKFNDYIKALSIPLWSYTWLSEAHCNDIFYTLIRLPEAAKLPGGRIFFEKRGRKFFKITHGGGPTNPEKKEGVYVMGVMDLCRPWAGNTSHAKKTVWEIKYTDSLHPEHLLQVALYMLLLGEDSLGFLVSVRTGQTVQVLPKTESSLLEILQLLVDAKSGGEQKPLLNTYSDEEFLAECQSDFDGLVDKCALPPAFSLRPSGSKFKRAKKRLAS